MPSRIADLEPESLQRASRGDDVVVSVAAAKISQERAESDVTRHNCYAGAHHSVPAHTASVADVQAMHIQRVFWPDVDEIGRPDCTERAVSVICWVQMGVSIPPGLVGSAGALSGYPAQGGSQPV